MTVRIAMPFHPHHHHHHHLHLSPPSIMYPWPSPQPPPPPPPQQQQPRTPSLATEIIPRLYISDLSTAENPTILAALGITHVLSTMPGFVALPPALALAHAQIPLDDFPFSELAAHLPASTQFLRDALADPRARVLVHCVEGVSRSASVVSAFLIATRGLSPAQAVQFVKARRKVADPNSGFVAQLHEYADRLQSAPSSSLPTSSSSSSISSLSTPSASSSLVRKWPLGG